MHDKFHDELPQEVSSSEHVGTPQEITAGERLYEYMLGDLPAPDNDHTLSLKDVMAQKQAEQQSPVQDDKQ